MATQAETRNFKYLPAYYGDQGLVLPFSEGASQSFAADDPVQLSSGTLVAVASPPVAEVFVGFAMKAATGVTGAVIPVRVIRPSDVYEAHFDLDDTFTAADVGTKYGIKRAVAGGYWVVDQDDTTNVKCVVLGSAEWTRGTTNLNSENSFAARTGALSASAGGLIYVRFMEAAHEFSVTD